jgi:hypothetical protein
METVAFHLSSIPIATKGGKMEEIVGGDNTKPVALFTSLDVLFLLIHPPTTDGVVQRQLHLAVEWKYIISIYVFTAGLGVLECKIQSIFHQPH